MTRPGPPPAICDVEVIINCNGGYNYPALALTAPGEGKGRSTSGNNYKIGTFPKYGTVDSLFKRIVLKLK